jgi:quercetin dioxygenase-like cupin family protein
MKLFHIAAMVVLTAFSANVFAQPANPGQAAKGIKITKITGTVNIMKDGVVIMTLKPGDAIPELTDNKVTFAIVDGTVEVEAGGKKISAATGSNFTVTSNAGQVNVALGAGTPVAVKTESGNNVILTANSEVKMINANGNVNISMEKGNAVMTNASGGETQTVQTGQTVTVPSAPVVVAPVAPVAPKPVAPVVVDEAPVIVPVVEAPPPSVIPTTEIVQAVCEVSASSPECN